MTPVANGKQQKIVAATVPAVVKAPNSLQIVRDFVVMCARRRGFQRPGIPRSFEPEALHRTTASNLAACGKTHRGHAAVSRVRSASAPEAAARGGSAFVQRRIRG